MTHASAGQNRLASACMLNTTNITLEIINRCLSFTGRDLTCSSTIGRTSPNDLWSNYRLSKLIVLHVAAQGLWRPAPQMTWFIAPRFEKGQGILAVPNRWEGDQSASSEGSPDCRLQEFSLVKCQLWEVGLRSSVRSNFYRHVTYRISLLCEEQLASLLDCTCAI